MNGHLLKRLFAATILILFGGNSAVWPFSLGIENQSDPAFKLLKPDDGILPRIGVITNQTGRTQTGLRTVDVLKDDGVRILYILAPEHGFDGKTSAGKPVVHAVDKQTGIPIVSIYGRGGDQTIAGKQLDPLILKQLDMLVYDIQDSGMRHYTYISTMLCALEASATYKKPLIVFDRPNLLGPNMEGPLVTPELKSFISMIPVPLRHGMTVGELAQFCNKHVLSKSAELHVVPMKEYNRSKTAPFLAGLSPNIPSLSSLHGYSFLGMLGEIKPFDVGVGTSNAFQMILLPESMRIPPFEWHKLAAILKTYGIHGHHSNLTRRNLNFSGLQLSFPDEPTFASFQVLLDVIQFFRERSISLVFSGVFDKAAGTTKVKEWCDKDCSQDLLVSSVNEDLKRFYEKAKEVFIYKPHPKMVTLDKKKEA